MTDVQFSSLQQLLLIIGGTVKSLPQPVQNAGLQQHVCTIGNTRYLAVTHSFSMFS